MVVGWVRVGVGVVRGFSPQGAVLSPRLFSLLSYRLPTSLYFYPSLQSFPSLIQDRGCPCTIRVCDSSPPTPFFPLRGPPPSNPTPSAPTPTSATCFLSVIVSHGPAH